MFTSFTVLQDRRVENCLLKWSVYFPFFVRIVE